MVKALIVYATRSGETKRIAEFIAEGLRFSVIDVTLADAKSIKNETQLAGYDAVLLGSATYHGEMMQSMKTLLFLAEQAKLDHTVGGSFGAFGWSGEAPERIYDTMKNIFEMDMVNSPMMLKSSSIDGGIKMAQEYGREIAKKIEAKA